VRRAKSHTRQARRSRRGISAALCLFAIPLFAQLPPSGTLSDTDKPLFQAEVARLERLLSSAPDIATVTYVMARTWASAKQWPEALDWLGRATALKAGLDPSRDSMFSELRGTAEFEAVLRSVRQATPEVTHSRLAFTVQEAGLVPESVAYDPNRKSFYFGSMRKGKIVRCSNTGDCVEFSGGLGEVLGLKVYGGGLWALNNGAKESALMQYDLASGRLVRRYPAPGTGHIFNDLVFAPSGELYLTDTSAGLVWRLAKGGAELEPLPGKFEQANGIAVSSNGRFLYVSCFPDGIHVVDLTSNRSRPIGHPKELCLATIDGLYFYRNSLIAIQNAIITPRVVRFYLTGDRAGIERFEVLERRNPWFNGITTGVVVGDDFYFMANIQDDKPAGFNPIRILRIRL
jgi:sugar lactone lactonase YvrE